MLFLPQKELDNGLFIKLIGIISVIHLLVLFSLFISEYVYHGKALVLNMGSGARVRMLPGGLFHSGNGGGASRRSELQQSQESSTDVRKNHDLNNEVLTGAKPQMALGASTKKTQVESSIPAPLKKEPINKKDALKAKESTKEPAKELIKQKEPVVPGFSPLKKSAKTVPDYSPINKSTSKDEKKHSEKSRVISSVDGYSALATKVDRKVNEKQKSELEQPPVGGKAESLQAATPVKPDSSASSMSASNANAHAGYGAGTGGGSGHGSGDGAVDAVDIHGAEPGWSDNEYAHEFFKYYAEPPGFKDRETFTITFDVIDGKASNISPRGFEPLILYAAAKDAILKMTFARSSYAEKKVFII